MTEKRFRMETIGDVMLPFIVDNSTAKKESDTITTYHTYETHRKEKCLELVDLLNDFSEENKQLKHNNRMLSMKMSEIYTNYRLLKEFSEDTNPNDAVKKVLSELMQITKEYR